MDQYNENSRPSTVTCLSAENHDCDIKDYMLHYLGCLEICEREDFFTEKNSLWEREIQHQERLCNDPIKAKDIVQAKREVWDSNCKSELRRIDFLRKTLAQDPDDKHLVDKLKESADSWRNSNRDNITQVRNWRERRGKSNSKPTYIEIKEAKKYEPEKDVNVPIIQFENGAGVNLPTKDGRVWNRFPNQKTTLNKLLDDEDSLLHKKHSPNRLRYFHVPSNNMIWAEQAIARYFGDERPDYHATHRELIRKKKTSTYMILREPYWRSQLHGGQQHSPPHERHLRPLCTVISSDPGNKDHFPNNMVLFMPYLHWDTSRKREQFAAEIESIMDSAKSDIAKCEKIRKENRQKSRLELSTNSPNGSVSRGGDTGSSSTSVAPEGHDRPDEPESSGRPIKNFRLQSRILTMTGLLKELELLKSRLPVDDMGRVKVDNKLGQFLLDAARLYEGMSNYRDKKLLRKYLSADPPLHPRRTLDQAYYWTLNSTRKRDRDQVVYRGTTAKSEDFHTYDRSSKNDDVWKWTKHEEFGIKGPCEECKINIQKLSRVIMVDQLWMWILDANTIITCFPKRYGANKQDSSGVHKSIRTRLQDSGPDIRTVFDLALIIIDECSNTFFDRTKTIDRQPQVIDAFSKAIGTIMYKQTAAFERLWRWTDKASDIYRSAGNPDTSELHVPLLDINPEGRLEREIKDIIEELDIMIHITKIHKRMLTTFITNAENILDPTGKFGGNQKRQMAAHYFSSKSKKPADIAGINSEEGEDTHKKGEDYNWFKLNADERVENVLTRIEELEELRSSAANTAQSVKDLLELKQQQASVVQAWQAVKQSEESIRQGRSIMMFTIVTIVFLPLSFMSSVFGMNNIEISGDSWSIKEEFVYMFPISAGVIFLSLVLAFGGWVRSGIFWLWKSLWTPLLVKFGIYGLWLDFGLPSHSVYRNANEWSDRLKANARVARFEKKRREREAKDKKAAAEAARRKNEDETGSRATVCTGARPSVREYFGHKQTNGSAV